MKRLFALIAVAIALCCCLVMGCSSGASNTYSSSASASSSAASASADTAKSSSASFSSNAVSITSSADVATNSDFDRAIVGTWHIYSAEIAHKNDGGSDKIDAQTMALLRRYGLHDTITIFHDGTFSTSDNGNGTWQQKDRSVLTLTYNDAEEPSELTLKDNRLILERGENVGTVVYARG